jgi:hypothetical protein
MKARLNRRDNDYWLHNESGETIASSWGVSGKKLSIKNCNEIFLSSVVDVERLAEYSVQEVKESNADFYLRDVYKEFFIEGFNKAMELNKDKVFTLGQLITAMDMARVMVDGKYANSGEYIYNFIQQPTEIEVEIEMKKVVDETKVIGAVKGVKGSGDKITTYKSVSKLDENGCLILRNL